MDGTMEPRAGDVQQEQVGLDITHGAIVFYHCTMHGNGRETTAEDSREQRPS